MIKTSISQSIMFLQNQNLIVTMSDQDLVCFVLKILFLLFFILFNGFTMLFLCDKYFTFYHLAYLDSLLDHQKRPNRHSWHIQDPNWKHYDDMLTNCKWYMMEFCGLWKLQVTARNGCPVTTTVFVHCSMYIEHTTHWTHYTLSNMH